MKKKEFWSHIFFRAMSGSVLLFPQFSSVPVPHLDARGYLAWTSLGILLFRSLYSKFSTSRQFSLAASSVQFSSVRGIIFKVQCGHYVQFSSGQSCGVRGPTGKCAASDGSTSLFITGDAAAAAARRDCATSGFPRWNPGSARQVCSLSRSNHVARCLEHGLMHQFAAYFLSCTCFKPCSVLWSSLKAPKKECSTVQPSLFYGTC